MAVTAGREIINIHDMPAAQWDWLDRAIADCIHQSQLGRQRCASLNEINITEGENTRILRRLCVLKRSPLELKKLAKFQLCFLI